MFVEIYIIFSFSITLSVVELMDGQCIKMCMEKLIFNIPTLNRFDIIMCTQLVILIFPSIPIFFMFFRNVIRDYVWENNTLNMFTKMTMQLLDYLIFVIVFPCSW